MHNADFYLTMAAATLAGLGMLTMAALSGWRGWLSLQARHLELAAPGDHHRPTTPNASARIEIADLKERIRKLEAIAAGVDL